MAETNSCAFMDGAFNNILSTNSKFIDSDHQTPYLSILLILVSPSEMVSLFLFHESLANSDIYVKVMENTYNLLARLFSLGMV